MPAYYWAYAKKMPDLYHETLPIKEIILLSNINSLLFSLPYMLVLPPDLD